MLVLSGDHIYAMNYGPMIDFHREAGADLTVGFIKVEKEKALRFGIGQIENGNPLGGRLLDYREKPENRPDWPEPEMWASLTIYIFTPHVLYEVLKKHAGRAPASHEFGKDIIPMMLEHYKVFAYKYEGYWGYTRTIDEYWQTSMDMLGEHPKIQPENWRVRTNLEHNSTRDRTPALIGSSAKIENSLIYSGCRVHGTVKNSILFPGVEVSEEATIEDSILMFDTQVQAGTMLHKVITDTHVVIGAECLIGRGDVAIANEEFPHLLTSGITLIGQHAHVPGKRRIGSNCIVHPDLVENQFRQTEYESGLSIR